LGQCFRTACLSPLQLMTSQERALAFLRGHIGRSCPSTPVATREGFRNSSSASPAGTTASYANSTTDWAVDHRCLEPNEPLAARLPRSSCPEVSKLPPRETPEWPICRGRATCSLRNVSWPPPSTAGPWPALPGRGFHASAGRHSARVGGTKFLGPRPQSAPLD
jgi:hypothetical protein